jgi:hypothetical protein
MAVRSVVVPGPAVPGLAVPGAMTPGWPLSPAVTPPLLLAFGTVTTAWTALTPETAWHFGAPQADESADSPQLTP